MSDGFAMQTENGVWTVTKKDLEDVEIVATATIGKGKQKTELKAGTYVWVVPEDMTPTKARDQDKNPMELREIGEIMRHRGRKKFIYKCGVYLRGSNINDAGPLDRMQLGTKRTLRSLGGVQEFLLTTAYEYVWETRIEAVVNVAKLDPSKANFPTLFPGQPFTRVDLELYQVQLGMRWGWNATRAPQVVCKSNCKLQRIYAPNRQEMRWCKTCKKWYHTECMNAKDTGAHYFNVPENVEQLSDSWYAWEYIEHLRIARVPRHNDCHDGVPYTIETMLPKLRQAKDEYDGQPGAARPEFFKYLARLLQQDARPRGDQLRMYNEMKELIPQTLEQMWYKCPGYECNEMI
ncbi:hypothetical protein LXA43DRAFT_1105320 [Ganoderma leucocontextum]|nr:hypothetical protein LXA43DRAFT_1105320 [Ganoderma leucocontextum]